MKVDGKTIGDAKQFTIEEQFHDWFHEGLNAEDVSVKIKEMYEDYCVCLLYTSPSPRDRG